MIFIRRVEGASMMPALPAGKIVIARKWVRPKVGDIVIAIHQSREIIKRVGELRQGLVYLVGDNPEASTDSRQFGWLPLTAVLGVVKVKKAL